MCVDWGGVCEVCMYMYKDAYMHVQITWHMHAHVPARLWFNRASGGLARGKVGSVLAAFLRLEKGVVVVVPALLSLCVKEGATSSMTRPVLLSMIGGAQSHCNQ